jgi:hypothetical protein
VSKPVLGRGLGHLLNGTKSVVEVQERPVPTSDTCPELPGPGLEKLLRGNVTEEPSPRRFGLLQWSLVGADLVLLIQAARLVLAKAAPLNLADLLLCFLAVGLGAWLSCLALLSRSK